MIAPTTLNSIAQTLLLSGCSEAAICELRAQFEPVHLVFCSDDEMGAAEPYREYQDFNLYLIHDSGHCMGLTDDLDSAFGMVVAEIDP